MLEETIPCIVKYAVNFWEATNGNLLFCLGSLFDTPDQQLEEMFSMPDTKVFVRLLSLSSHVS